MPNDAPDNPPIWVDNPETFNQMLAQLQPAPLVAVDTESDSLHVYFEKVCLLQLSVPGTDYVVDPLRVDVTPLAGIFASEAQEKVFHAAEYDILCLKRDYGFTFANLFDTMIAARILGWKHYGLGPILQERFQVQLDKRMQRFDWGTRPLPPTALDYARMDTHYLQRLRDLQLQELEANGRLTEARGAFERRTCLDPPIRNFDPDGFWRIPGARQLEPSAQAVLRELYVFRDELAREADRPPFKVIPNTTLVQMATSPPSDRRALARLKGLSQHIRRRHADRLLAAITRGLRSSPPVPPNHARSRQSDVTTCRYEALRIWRKKVAEVRHVDPDVILTNQALMELARRAPLTADALSQVKTMDEWQRRTYGEDVLEVLKRRKQPTANDKPQVAAEQS